ncbi:MAG: glycosyltransferase family 2 protein [Candidatus Auribacterota bacterium]
MAQGISVIIPAYNRGKFIEECLKSVFTQTVQPDEIIVVDDGSKDNTPEIIKKLQKQHPTLRYIHQPNAGSAVARSTGLLASNNDIIAFLDSDDLWEPLHLEESLKALEIYPEASFAFADFEVKSMHATLSEDFLKKYCARRGFVRQYLRLIERVTDDKYFLLNGEYLKHLILMRLDYIATSNLVFHRGRVNAHIFFDNALRIGQDVDFILQYLKMGAQAVYIDSVHSIYVIHDKNIVMINEDENKHFITLSEEKKLEIYTQSIEKRLMFCTQADEFEVTFRWLADYYWFIALGLNDNEQYTQAHLYFSLSYKFKRRFACLKHIIIYALFGEKGKRFVMSLLRKIKKAPGH